MVPADLVIALGAARAWKHKALAGAQPVPHDGEEAAHAAAHRRKPQDGEPPHGVGEQLVGPQGDRQNIGGDAHQANVGHF